MERWYAEWTHGYHTLRSPTFERREDLIEYLANIDMTEEQVSIFCDL